MIYILGLGMDIDMDNGSKYFQEVMSSEKMAIKEYNPSNDSYTVTVAEHETLISRNEMKLKFFKMCSSEDFSYEGNPIIYWNIICDNK